MLAACVGLAAPAHAQAPDEAALGTPMPMPDASMTDVRGGQFTLADLQGAAATVVVFWSNQCPWVDRYEDRFIEIAETYGDRGVAFVLVNSNDTRAYPKESPQESAVRYREAGYPPSVTYLTDPTSRLANAFGAKRTPHVYVFDGGATLIYAGAIDDSPGDPDHVEQHHLRDVLDGVTGDLDVEPSRTSAFGCTIKFSS
ncbi:MAG: thioredoxin family protein [Rhodothermales bacterium]